jgi:hypothetical protein
MTKNYNKLFHDPEKIPPDTTALTDQDRPTAHLSYAINSAELPVQRKAAPRPTKAHSPPLPPHAQCAVSRQQDTKLVTNQPRKQYRSPEKTNPNSRISRYHHKNDLFKHRPRNENSPRLSCTTTSSIYKKNKI